MLKKNRILLLWHRGLFFASSALFLTLIWPTQSPYLNTIEHLWDYLKRKLAEYNEPPQGMIELWERVEVEWEKIPQDICTKLIDTMPKRIKAVIKAKWGYTKY